MSRIIFNNPDSNMEMRTFNRVVHTTVTVSGVEKRGLVFYSTEYYPLFFELDDESCKRILVDLMKCDYTTLLDMDSPTQNFFHIKDYAKDK